MKNSKRVSIKTEASDEVRRSENANAYFWVLCGKLAVKTQQRKIDIYKEFIRNLGDNFEIYSVKNEFVNDFVRDWGDGHLGWVCDVIGEGETEGYSDVVAYRGSSTYSKEQMSALIDAAIIECQEQGIKVLSPSKIKKLKELW